MNWNDDSAVCAKAREAIADGVLAGDRRETMEQHIASCAECQAYRSDCESMWQRLGELPTPTPAPDARRRFDAALGGGSRARSLPWERFAVAAALVVAALIGYGAGGLRERSSPSRVGSASTDAAPRFLLLLYDSANVAEPSPERHLAIVAEYSSWARSLESEGRLVSAEELSDTPVWLGGSVRTTDGAHVGGFFLIRARDLAEARRIAERCPHLKYGGRIELRPIHPT